MTKGNAARASDFFLQKEFPVGCAVWQRWGSMGWRPANRPTIPNLKTAIAVVDAGGEIVRFCETEREATDLARQYVEQDGRTYYLLRPFKEFSIAKPPVREVAIRVPR